MNSSHVIVLPGGGYGMLSDNEREIVADRLRSLGLSASIFDYPVQARHPAPLDAVRAEIRRVRSAGAERVALLGFSAGGHLAGHAALAAGEEADERVDAAVLCYPVVSMELATHRGSQDELLGPDAGGELRAATSLDRLVTADAPPFFIWHTAADEAVPVQHAYLLAQALAAHFVPHALHVFTEGEHGLGLAEGQGAAEQWIRLAAEWLQARGW
ncbi:alpha/beta hydrolase [Arthrobacter cheniae]|uniref:Alpha/beta hydrolase n=1 Tax=Arthrobacter cheniae TaxID=1258888 RepID=A0A3A5M203_9MICC|nr:prolyl oligopeptidase family serine peptidase [Arthrobacter cheniae]RJT80061.1 alpha/beta hydrolase [Arthrobacter cheniae]